MCWRAVGPKCDQVQAKVAAGPSAGLRSVQPAQAGFLSTGPGGQPWVAVEFASLGV